MYQCIYGQYWFCLPPYTSIHKAHHPNQNVGNFNFWKDIWLYRDRKTYSMKPHHYEVTLWATICIHRMSWWFCCKTQSSPTGFRWLCLGLPFTFNLLLWNEPLPGTQEDTKELHSPACLRSHCCCHQNDDSYNDNSKSLHAVWESSSYLFQNTTGHLMKSMVGDHQMLHLLVQFHFWKWSQETEKGKGKLSAQVPMGGSGASFWVGVWPHQSMCSFH